MAPDTFARERLGWWSPVVTEKLDYALDKNAWDRCASDDEKPEGKTCLLYTSPRPRARTRSRMPSSA